MILTMMVICYTLIWSVVQLAGGLGWHSWPCSLKIIRRYIATFSNRSAATLQSTYASPATLQPSQKYMRYIYIYFCTHTDHLLDAMGSLHSSLATLQPSLLLHYNTLKKDPPLGLNVEYLDTLQLSEVSPNLGMICSQRCVVCEVLIKEIISHFLNSTLLFD